MKEQEKLKSTVLKLYSAGIKVADIITQTGVPRSTVYYWIKNGIPKELSPLNLRDYHFLKQKCERQEKIIKILNLTKGKLWKPNALRKTTRASSAAPAEKRFCPLAIPRATIAPSASHPCTWI